METYLFLETGSMKLVPIDRSISDNDSKEKTLFQRADQIHLTLGRSFVHCTFDKTVLTSNKT